ncbi:hypothetical protein [Streptosporangium sp. KLBMP 9127]|nr:hypothetical protein [Streptosporangium sp. KLBMP 9127]
MIRPVLARSAIGSQGLFDESHPPRVVSKNPEGEETSLDTADWNTTTVIDGPPARATGHRRRSPAPVAVIGTWLKIRGFHGSVSWAIGRIRHSDAVVIDARRQAQCPLALPGIGSWLGAPAVCGLRDGRARLST